MAEASLPSAISSFLEYFGGLGLRWGLPKIPCQVHAYLYLMPKPITLAELQSDLGLSEQDVAEAIDFLEDYLLVVGKADQGWTTTGDPWELLLTGLEKRRERELPGALKTLRNCSHAAQSDVSVDPAVGSQINKVLQMVEDIAVIDVHAHRLSPQMLKRIVRISGRAARLFGGPRREGEETK